MQIDEVYHWADKGTVWVKTNPKMEHKTQHVTDGTESKEVYAASSVPPIPLTVYSYNIDGLRPEVWSWLKAYLLNERPHIMCLNETKRTEHVLKQHFAQIASDYTAIINCHNPARYHGVAVLVRKDVPFQRLAVKMNCSVRSDTKEVKDPACGRVIALQVASKLNIVATYCPNSGVDRREPLKNLPYRVQQWDPALFQYLEFLRGVAQKLTLWIGDINVAPEPCDVSDAKRMARWAGFTREERQSFASLIQTGQWFDVWRLQHPVSSKDKKKNIAYSYRGKPGKWRKTFGLRLDHCIVSADLLPDVTSSFILSNEDCPAPTDHVPVGVRIKNIL